MTHWDWTVMAVRRLAVDAGLLVIVLVSLATRCRLKPQVRISVMLNTQIA